MNETMDEFETQLSDLKPAAVCAGAFARVQNGMARRQTRRINWAVAFGMFATAACVALTLVVIERNRPVQRNQIALRTQLDELQLANNNYDTSRRLDLSTQYENEKKAYAAFGEKMKLQRFPTEEPIVRHPDGSIVAVAENNIVYINLGQGDHILTGLTFEVYSKVDGIPALGDGLSDDKLPVGEASIEVQKVEAARSQCRITKLEPGKTIAQGDLIANLVYDRVAKFKFVVYGNFDLQQTGHPTEEQGKADAEVIKSLVAQWGGKLQPDINIDTDFVIFGYEPKVETFTAGDLKDPFIQKKYNDELAAQKAYQDEIGKAKDLTIPIMNQNRFLYFCGYYDLATR